MKSEMGKEETLIPRYIVKMVTATGFWGSVLPRYSEELCGCIYNCLSGGQKTNSPTPIHICGGGRPTGCWLFSYFQLYPHRLYHDGSPYCGLRQILDQAARPHGELP